jgi:hypothetical protein
VHEYQRQDTEPVNLFFMGYSTGVNGSLRINPTKDGGPDISGFIILYFHIIRFFECPSKATYAESSGLGLKASESMPGNIRLRGYYSQRQQKYQQPIRQHDFLGLTY